MPMLGFTVINGRPGPRQTAPRRRSLAERLRAKHNGGLRIVPVGKHNPDMTLSFTGLSKREVGNLAERLTGERKSKPRSARKTGEKKMARRRMSLAEKKAFVRRMKRAKSAKANPRRHRRHAVKANPRHLRYKRNPTREQVRAAMRGANARLRESEVMSRISRAESGGRDISSVAPAAPRRRKSKSKSKKVTRRHHPSTARSIVSLTKKIAALERGKKRRKSGKTPYWVNTRLRALKARKRSIVTMSPQASAYLKLHGLSKVNPSGVGALKDSGKALVGVLPEVLATVASAGVHTYVGAKASEMLVKKYGASYASWSGAVSSLAVGILGFLGLRMYSQTAKYSVPFLTGGVVGAGINLLADNHVAAVGTAPALSWGRKLALPIGAVVLRSEFAAFDPLARHQAESMGEVLPRGDFKGYGEVVSRRESVAMLGEAEDRALARLLGEAGVLENDSSSGF